MSVAMERRGSRPLRRRAQREEEAAAAVLVAVSPPSLARVVDHLLSERSDLVVAHVAAGNTLARDVARLLPRVVIAMARRDS